MLESKELFEKTFASQSAAIMILDTGEPPTILECNPATTRIFGYSRDELVGKTTRLLHIDATSVETFLRKIREAGDGQDSPKPFEHIMMRKNGDVFPSEQTVARLTDENGVHEGWINVIRDITERKRVEDELRLQRDFAQSVFDTAQAIMLILDKDGRINNFNHYMEEISGYRLDEVRGKDWFTTFLPEADRSKVRQIFKRAIDDVQTCGNINPIVTKDGKLRDIEWYDEVLRDIDGNVIGILAVGQDVTDRNRAEEKHQTILRTTREGFWIVDLSGEILEVNDSYCEIVGYTREELLKMNIADVEALDNPDEIQSRISQIRDYGSARFESQHRRKDSRIVEVEVNANYIDIAEGQIAVFVRDITLQKKAQDRINHLNHTLDAIRNINQLITREKNLDKIIKGVCDNLIETRSCNAAWIILLEESRKLITYAVAGLRSQLLPVTDLLREGKLPACVQQALKQARVVITRNPQETCALCPVGSESDDTGCMTVRLEHEGDIYGILSASIPKSILSDKDEANLFQEVAGDIAFAIHNMELEDENKLLEQERINTAKLESISTLAGGIAHDFNNLLSGIMGNIGLSKMFVDPGEKIYEMLNEAEKATERARDLTQQLLTFARGGKPVKKSVNIAGLIEESATFALRGSAVKLELWLKDDIRPVEVDEGQINQVIQNIVINADEAMPDGGVLRIRAENAVVKRGSALPLPKGDYVLINIEDTGTGMSREDLGRIFEPYFTTKQKGSGLGLSTAYSIIKNHGGYITAESVRGKGTTFHIYIPASGKPTVEGEKMVAEEKLQPGGSILVMDDEEIIRKMLGNMLQVVGYSTELANDGTEALEKYEQAMKSKKPFDAVIMDLTIPGGMGGKEAVKKLLQIDPRAKVIVSSGYATDPIMSEYKKFGFSAVIAKPYSVGQLEETLRDLGMNGNPA